uniref:Uncharacterized protein n=1 Tax=Chenopodium quinoa TaxID=63459 RepID=A0A803LY85_CHEQI
MQYSVVVVMMLVIATAVVMRIISKTLGGKVKESGTVIASFKSKKKAMNVNCPVETLGRILGNFDDNKKRVVREMGFGGLFYLKWLPRQLAFWLCTRVDVSKRCLLTLDGQLFPLDPIQVHCVLGLPYGPRVVPKKVVDQELEDTLWNTYSTTTRCETRGITRKTLVEYLEGPCVDEDEFKKVFLMYVLNVLCSSTCHRIKKQFLHGVSVADNAPLYNWCEFVLDELMKALVQFSKRIYGDDLNFNASSGGCTLFLSCVNVKYRWDHPLKAGDILPSRRKRSKDCADVLNALKTVLNKEGVLEEEPEEVELETNPQNVMRRRKATTDRPIDRDTNLGEGNANDADKSVVNVDVHEAVMANDADKSADVHEVVMGDDELVDV